jgi:cardiolipin synthase
MQPIYTYMESARTSLDMTMYALEDTEAEQILGTDAADGVKVRVILDGSSNEKSNNTPAYDYLQAHGVGVVWSSTSYTYTHEKSIIVDDTSAAIMTLNLQSQYYSTSRDFAVIDTDSADVDADEATFSADYAHSPVTPGDGDNLVWSPTDSQEQLLALIGSAKKSLAVENEEMSDTDIVDALSNAAEHGVAVTVTMTDSSDYTSEWDELTKAGVKVVTYSPDASLYIHAKVIVVDSGTPAARAFVGSENFSTTSLDDNRELGLITTDSTVVASLASTLAGDFAGGTPYVT